MRAHIKQLVSLYIKNLKFQVFFSQKPRIFAIIYRFLLQNRREWLRYRNHP